MKITKTTFLTLIICLVLGCANEDDIPSEDIKTEFNVIVRKTVVRVEKA